MTVSAIRRSTLLALSAALATAAITPAVATKRSVVTVPKSALKDPTSKLCMPRSTSLTAAKDKTLPETLCLTTDEWAGHGVTIVTK